TSIISFSDVQEEPSLFLDQLKKTYTSLGLSFYTNDQAIPAQSHSEIIYTKLNYAYLKLINAIQKNQQEQQQSNFDAFNSVLKELRPPDIDYVKNLYKKIHDALYYQAYGFEHLLYAEKHLAVEKKIDKMAHIDELVDFLNNEYTALFSGISKLTDYSMPIRNAAQYIESNYRTIEGLIEVAMYVNLNPEYFSRLFKKETGENFNNYLNDCRLENSIDLLLNSNKKLYHIAEEVGFSSLSYYSKKFKDRYGINPFTYRSTSGKADDDYKK
ncbi:MAG: helix-turn-helix transcriptional regulator, partial [Christensenellales bacterium]